MFGFLEPLTCNTADPNKLNEIFALSQLLTMLYIVYLLTSPPIEQCFISMSLTVTLNKLICSEFISCEFFFSLYVIILSNVTFMS